MANGQSIDELVSEFALAQLDKLEQKLVINKKAFVDTAKAAKTFTDAIGGSKNLKDYSNAVDKAVKGNVALGNSSDRVRLAEIKLETARRKSFDDYERRLAKQEQAIIKQEAAAQSASAKAQARIDREIKEQQKLLESDTINRNARIRNIDQYNQRLERQAAADQARAANEARTQQRQLESDLALRNARIRNIDQYNRKLEDQARKQQQANAKQEQDVLRQVRAAEALRTPYNRLNVELGVLRTRARDIGVEFGINSRQFKDAAAGVQVLDKRIKDLDARLGQHQKNGGNYGSALGGIRSDMLGLAAGYLSAGQALSFVFDKTLQFERIKTPLTYILGSEGDASVKLRELKEIANELGLEYFTLAESYKSFTAAAIASNFPMKDSEKIFLSVSKAAAVLKLSDEQLKGALLALQQMISKGNVQAEELRGQLAERLPGAFALAAKAMGVTERRLNELLKNGEVLASELLPKLALQLDKRYGDKAAAGIRGLSAELGGFNSALQSLGGEGSRLNDNLFQPIVRGAKLVVLELGKLFRGTAWENLTRLMTFKQSSLDNQDKAFDLRDQYKNSRSSLNASSERDYEESGLGELRNYYAQLQKNVEDADKAYRQFSQGVKKGALKEEFSGQLQAYAKLRDDLASERKLVGIEIDKRKKEAIVSSKEIADAELTAISAIRKRITELQKLPGSAIIGSDIDTRIKALQARLAKPGKGPKIAFDSSSFDIEKSNLEGASNNYKGNAENENFSEGNRLSELANYLEIRKQMILGDANKQRAAKELSDGQLELIESETQSKLTELMSYGNTQRLKIAGDQLSLMEKVRLDANKKELDQISEQETLKLSQLQQAYAKGTISKEQYEELKLDIESEYALKSIQAQIDQTKKLIETLALTDDQRAAALKTLRDLEIKYTDEANAHKISKAIITAEKQGEIDQKIIDKRSENLEKAKQIVGELFEFTTELVNASFTNQLNALQDELDLNDRRKAQDIENVNKSVATEEEKADRIAIINAKAESQQNLIEQRQREVKTRQARADKAAAVSQALINGALAMTKVAAQTGILTFAFSPLIAALTGLQIATILAQPIPKFEHGGTMKESGLAMYGEVGSELQIDPSGKLSLTPDKPTVGFVQAGTQFISNKDLVRMMNMPDPVVNVGGSNINIKPLLEATQQGNNKLDKLIKATNSKPSGPPALSKRGLYETNNQSVRLADWKRRNL